jgi:hypothetical protein
MPDKQTLSGIAGGNVGACRAMWGARRRTTNRVGGTVGQCEEVSGVVWLCRLTWFQVFSGGRVSRIDAAIFRDRATAMDSCAE